MAPFLLCLLLPVAPALAESPWSPPPAPVGWSATDATFHLVIRDGEPVRVEGRYTFTTPDDRSAVLQLAGPELVLTELSGPVLATKSGVELALGPGSRQHVQAFAGLYEPTTPGALNLGVLPAARTQVIVDAPGLDVEVAGAVDGWLPAGERLRVSWRPHVERSEVRESLVMQGQAAHSFRGSEAGLRVDSVLRWKIVRGKAARLSFEAAGLQELEVVGPGVKTWRREGTRVVIEPRAEAMGLFVVQVSGRVRLGKGELTIPTPEPTGVVRTDRYVTMYRSDLGELIPTQMPSSVPLEKLPGWAANLTEGVPLVAWHGPQPVRVLGMTADTVQGPDTVVTQARYILSTAQEGRAGLRMVLRVRNERRQYLQVRPPPGWKPVVVRVGNQPVSWLSDGNGGIYIPLEKSIETVRGLLSFPVDVEWMARDLPAWARRGEMQLHLPSLDAPVQQAEWEVHLPRGYRAVRPQLSGRDRVLLATDLRGDGIEEDSTVHAERRARIDTVSSALDNASSAYKDNDFQTAQRWLDTARTVDDSNEEVAQLQENLDVLTGSSTKNDRASRRVKDLAKAKTSGKAFQQEVVEKEAEYAYRSGDYDKAEAKLEEALALATELQQTEQSESVAQTSRIREANEKLADVRAQKSQQDSNGFFAGLGLLGDSLEGSETSGASFSFEGHATSGYGMGSGSGRGEGSSFSGADEGADLPPVEEPAMVVMSQEYLAKVPSHRSFQTVTGSAPSSGGEYGADEYGADEEEQDGDGRDGDGWVADEKPEASRPTASPRPGKSGGRTGGVLAGKKAQAEAPPEPDMEPAPVTVSALAAEVTVTRPLFGGAKGRPKESANKSVAGPPPPPSAPPPATPSATSPASAAAPVPMASDDERTSMMYALGYTMEPADQGLDATRTGEPESASRGESSLLRPLPERRASLQASPSPMALALPLDGPTVTTTQALLPAGKFPEFRFLYRSTLKDQP